MREYINRHGIRLDMRFDSDCKIHEDLTNFRKIGGGEFRSKEQYIKFCLQYTKEHYFDSRPNQIGEGALSAIMKKMDELEKKIEEQHLIMLKEIDKLTKGNMENHSEIQSHKKVDSESEKEMMELAKMWG